MHLSLGNTSRGLLAGAITGNAAILVVAIQSGDWITFLCGGITSVATLAGALIDPGSAPPKAEAVK